MKISKLLTLIIMFLTLLTLTTTLTVKAIPDIIIPDDYSNIQAGIDNAQPYDDILVRPGTYHETIDIDIPLTLYGDGTGEVIIDGLGGYQIVDVTAPYVELINLTITNGGYGIDLSNADYAYIEQCNVEYCTYVGISGYDSFDIWIIGGLMRFNDDGIELTYCDRAWLTQVWCSDNTNHGITIYHSEEVWINGVASLLNQGDGLYIYRGKDSYITDSSFMGNTNEGIDLTDSQDISVCNSECLTNQYGIELWYSTDCYISKTELSHNEHGIYPWESDAVVVNSVINDNTDCGVYSWDSKLDFRYCDISNNNYGVEVYNSEINAELCWWGC